MIEAYAFLAAFTVQVFVTSVLLPAWFVRHIRAQTANAPAERLEQLYPGVDVQAAQSRFLNRYKALTTAIAALGLLLLGWLFSYMQTPTWDEGKVGLAATIYFLTAQMLPLLLFAWFYVTFNSGHKQSPERKRTAHLQRRGLFDFVSPLSVGLAVLVYFLFVAFVLYLRRHPFPTFAGLINLGAITLVYALNAFVVYVMLYGKAKNPLQTHEARLHTMGLAVKSSVYSCIAIVIYISLNLSLRLLDLNNWAPFSLSVFFVICALLASIGYAAPLRHSSVSRLNGRSAS